MFDMVQDLVPLLGKPNNTKTRQLACVLFGEEPVIQPGDPISYWIFRNTGIDLAFQDDVLGTIFLYPLAPPNRPPYKGLFLPRLQPGATQQDVRAALGPPTKGGGGEEIICDRDGNLLGYMCYWDRYEWPEFVFLCEYDRTPDRKLALVALMQPGYIPRYPEIFNE